MTNTTIAGIIALTNFFTTNSSIYHFNCDTYTTNRKEILTITNCPIMTVGYNTFLVKLNDEQWNQLTNHYTTTNTKVTFYQPNWNKIK